MQRIRSSANMMVFMTPSVIKNKPADEDFKSDISEKVFHLKNVGRMSTADSFIIHGSFRADSA